MTVENLQGYVRWRGDLTFADHPFNLVDNLVLSALAYLDLRGVVPGMGAGPGITVADAATRWRERRGTEDRTEGARRLTVVPHELLDDMAAAPRYAGAVLSDYVDTIDPDVGMQFSAVTVLLDDGSAYVAFRGTDNTILGWQEDFTMSFQVMPAQLQAADYLRHQLTRLSSVRVGGHSKGGNLALYAATRAPVASRPSILAVHNNDGPGLSPEVVDDSALAELATRIVTIVPEFAVVGTLFARGAFSHTVASSARGLLQHDLMTWQVEGTDLCRVPQVSSRSMAIDKALTAWLEEVDNEERRRFTEAFFAALRAGGATLILDVGRTEYGSFESVIFALRRSREQTRGPLRQAARVTLQALRDVDYRALVRERETVRGGLLAAVGVLLVLVPDKSVQIIGALGVLTVVSVLATRLSRYLRRLRRRDDVSWARVVLWFLALAAALAAASNLDALVFPTNVLLAGGLLTHAWGTVRRAVRLRRTAPRRRGASGLLVVSGVVSFMLGAVALSTADTVLPLFVMQVGLYCLVAGVLEQLFSVHGRVTVQYVGAVGRALTTGVGSPEIATRQIATREH